METKPTVPISVAIPSFERRQSLLKTLERIAECSPQPAEILVHADGGWDPGLPGAEFAGIPLRVLTSAVLVGAGGGRDRMIREASQDFVASFDDDSWPLDTDYFARALALMDAFPQAMVVSATVYLQEKPVLPPMEEATTSRYFEGAASITRKSMYVQLPGYVPVPLPYGVEETDLSLQAHAAGFEIITSFWLRAWHDRPNADYQHVLAPWLPNEILLAFLRYPLWLQPLGWLRALRHLIKHRRAANLVELLRAVASSPSLCADYADYRHRYRAREIWSHRFTRQRRWLLGPLREKAPGQPSVSTRLAPPFKRVLYLQYTNPAFYPPLQHSAEILARSGWQVEFVGIHNASTQALEFPVYPRIRVRRMARCPPGWKQKLHYLGFALLALWRTLRFRPDWVYCSDFLSALPGRLVMKLLGRKVLYHEHDSPEVAASGPNWATRILARQHRLLAKSANVVVIPNEQRLAVFITEFRPSGETFCVWNAASVDEVSPPREVRASSQPLMLLYHGSIGPDRFSTTELRALARCGRHIRLRLIGYETANTIGYTDALMNEARSLGIGDRFEYLGTMNRPEMLQRGIECDVGLALLKIRGSDFNLQHMAGASNKPFDYLSQGLALIVPDDPEWKKLYVDNDCAMACEHGSIEALAEVFIWMDDHRDEVRRMGLKGQQLVRETWNYETQFLPVMAFMEHASNPVR